MEKDLGFSLEEGPKYVITKWKDSNPWLILFTGLSAVNVLVIWLPLNHNVHHITNYINLVITHFSCNTRSSNYRNKLYHKSLYHETLAIKLDIVCYSFNWSITWFYPRLLNLLSISATQILVFIILPHRNMLYVAVILGHDGGLEHANLNHKKTIHSAKNTCIHAPTNLKLLHIY